MPHSGTAKTKRTDALHVYAVGGDGGIQVEGALSTNHGYTRAIDGCGLGLGAAMQTGACS